MKDFGAPKKTAKAADTIYGTQYISHVSIHYSNKVVKDIKV